MKIDGKIVIAQPTLIQGQQSNSAIPKIVQSAQSQPIIAQQAVNRKVQGFQRLSQVKPLNRRFEAGTSNPSVLVANSQKQTIQSNLLGNLIPKQNIVVSSSDENVIGEICNDNSDKTETLPCKSFIHIH